MFTHGWDHILGNMLFLAIFGENVEARSTSHAAAVRFVKNPGAGRPHWHHAGPIRFCTWRPSGSRYFAYQTGPERRSTLTRGR